MGTYAPPPMGRRQGLTIAELIMRRGDIAARGAERSGQIWGNALAGLGQIAGGAVQQHGQRKEQEEQARLFDQALEQADWDNPEAALQTLLPVAGPDLSIKMVSAIGSIRKTQQGEEPTMEDVKVQVGTLAAVLEKYGPEYVGERWNVYGPALEPIAPLLGLEAIPQEFTSEVAEAIPLINEQLNPTQEQEPGAGFTLSPGQQRFGPEGEQIAAVSPKPPKSLDQIEKEAAAGAQGRASVEPPAGAAGPGRPKSWFDTKENKMLTLTDDQVLKMIEGDPGRLIDKVTGRNAMEEMSTTKRMDDLIVDAKWRLRRMQELNPLLDPIDFAVAWDSYRKMLGSLGQLFGRQVLRDVRVSEQDRAVYEATIGVPSMWVNLVDQKEAWARLILLERMMGEYETKYGDAPEGTMASDFLTVKASSRERAEAMVEDQIDLLKQDYEQGGGVPQAESAPTGGGGVIRYDAQGNRVGGE